MNGHYQSTLPYLVETLGAPVGGVCPRDEHGAISLGLIRLDGGARLSSLYVPPFGDPHAPPQEVVGRLPEPEDGPEHAPRLMLVLSEDQRAAHAALQKVQDNREAWTKAGFPPCAVSGGLLGARNVGMGGALLVDDGDIIRPDLSDDSGAGCLVLSIAGQTRASSAVSRGAAIVGPHVYKAADVSTWRVGVCPGHAVTMGKADNLVVKASRYNKEAPFEAVEATHVSPGASLREVQQFVAHGRMLSLIHI